MLQSKFFWLPILNMGREFMLLSLYFWVFSVSESMIKYFIIQSMGSSLFFISIIFYNMFNIIYMIMFSLMIKIGCPPFHLWFPSVMEGLAWYNCFILSTIQKIIPMILLSYLEMYLTVFVILSSIWGSIGGLSYSSMRKIIAYSSIYNLGWMISGLMINDYVWLFYFFIYSISLFMICNCFLNLGVNYLNQFFILGKSYLKSLLIMIIFMSLGGLPPFLGFLPKLVVMYCIVVSNMIVMCFVLILSALLIMFLYLRIVLTGIMVNSLSMKVINDNMPWQVFVFSMVGLLGMMLIVLLNFYF